MASNWRGATLLQINALPCDCRNSEPNRQSVLLLPIFVVRPYLHSIYRRIDLQMGRRVGSRDCISTVPAAILFANGAI